MKEEDTAKCSFIYGHSPRENLLGFISFPDSLDNDYEFSRFYSCLPFDDEWGFLDYHFDCTSLTQWVIPEESYKAWWLLGKNGEAVEVIQGKSKIEQIPGAGLNQKDGLGYVDRIKVIDGQLYVCGYRRQLYRRDGSNWTLLSKDIVAPKPASLDREEIKKMMVSFDDMDGIDANNIYTVGKNGEVFFYNGKSWQREDFPTNVHLNVITRISDNNMLIAGYQGIVGIGHHDQWRLYRYEENGPSKNWWGATEYKGTIYLCGLQGIWTLDRKSGEFNKVTIPIKNEYTSHQLFSNDGYLWSLGEKDILVFDGKQWQEIICPDNE